jgi:hypothetical protein
MTSDLAGDISTNIDSIKAVVKAHFQRKWMSDNGYMAELHDIVTANEDGKATLNIYEMNKNHLDGVIRSAAQFIESLQPMVTASNKDLSNMGIAEGTSTPSSDSGDDSGGGDDFNFGGGDDINFDDPVSPEDTGQPTDDVPPEETTEEVKPNDEVKVDEPAEGKPTT